MLVEAQKHIENLCKHWHLKNIAHFLITCLQKMVSKKRPTGIVNDRACHIYGKKSTLRTMFVKSQKHFQNHCKSWNLKSRGHIPVTLFGERK